jgi:hypothetical protein
MADIPATRELPPAVDNSEHEWLRPVFNQDGGSCGQASGIGYCFTYEINRLRGLAADVPENQYPDHYTWNFLNGGYGGGSWFFDGWVIVKASGIPDVATYGGMFNWGQTGWMDGYESYRIGMQNRLDEIITIDVSTEEGLEALKHWFYDHGNDEDSGGLVCFGAGVSDLQAYPLPAESNHSGELIIADWTLPVNHAMTFVGYDDSVKFDYNNDGLFTNDVDINNDGEINLRDWEIGAVKMLNSWGSNWANSGYCWVMYRTLAEPAESGGIWGNIVQSVIARAEYEPLLTLQAEISHNVRNTIRIGAGVSSTPGAIEPEVEMYFPHFNYQGGGWNLPGNNLPGAQPLEIGLDVTPLLSELEPEGEMQWWLIVQSEDPENQGDGTLVEYSFINETAEEIEILPGSQNNWGLINNWANYFNLPGEIDFEPIEIINEELPMACEGVYYEHQLVADGGHEPVDWEIKRVYNESVFMAEYPVVEWQELEVSDNDDGYVMVELPFYFKFYNDHIPTVTFITDGSLLMGGGFTYIRNEENLKSERCITGYGTDLMAYPEFGDGFYYYEGDDYVLFRWQVSRFDQPEYDADFVIALRQWDEIEFYYNSLEMTQSSDWVAGVSYGDSFSYDIASVSGSAGLVEEEVVCFEPEPFPDGEVAITDEGLFNATFMGVSDLYNPYQFHFMVTDSYGIYDEKTLGLWIATLDETESEIAAAAVLQQNYPNPFHAASGARANTAISYQLAAGGKVKLQIFNLKGQKVKNLVDETQTAGNYQVSWDGRNDHNEAVSAGVYFYRLQMNDQNITRKLILLK